jgi:hypothetical protein
LCVRVSPRSGVCVCVCVCVATAMSHQVCVLASTVCVSCVARAWLGSWVALASQVCVCVCATWDSRECVVCVRACVSGSACLCVLVLAEVRLTGRWVCLAGRGRVLFRTPGAPGVLLPARPGNTLDDCDGCRARKSAPNILTQPQHPFPLSPPPLALEGSNS